MWHLNRLYALIFALIICFSISNDLKATHIMGIDITYECLGNCTYRFHWRAYRDCDGYDVIDPTSMDFINISGANCAAPVEVNPWSTLVVEEVTPVCPLFPSVCTDPGSIVPGVQEYYQFIDFDICSPGCIYTIEWEDCCRNTTITSGAGSAGIYVGSTQINTAYPCNSSPQFNQPPIPYLCSGQTFTFNQGAYDPDGDDLVFSLGPCFDGAGFPVTYDPGYSPTEPLGPSWIVNLDALTGDLSFIPNPGDQEIGVVCVYVEEYRNGVLINTIVRDMQIKVLDPVLCGTNSYPVVDEVVNIQGGTSEGLDVFVCLGEKVELDFIIDDPGAGQIHTMWWNGGIQGADLYLSGDNTVQDTIVGGGIVGHFEWTPQVGGYYSFVLYVEDDACPIKAGNSYTVEVFVGDLTVNSVTAYPDCGGLVYYCADAFTTVPPLSFNWFGVGVGLNPNHEQACLTHTYNGTGTMAYGVEIKDGMGCTVIMEDSIVVSPPFVVDAGDPISLCNEGIAIVGTNNALDNVIYEWFPKDSVDYPFSPSTSIEMINNSNHPISHTYTVVGIDTITGCVESDSVVITVYNDPDPTWSNAGGVQCVENNNYCLEATGVNSIQALYQWDFVGANLTTSIGSSVCNVVYDGPGLHYVNLTVSERGCEASLDGYVEVWSNPIIDAGEDTSFCYGTGGVEVQSDILFSSSTVQFWDWTCPNGSPYCGVDSVNDDNPVLNPSQSTVFYLQVIDDNGCQSNMDSLMITILELPGVSAGQDLWLCGDDAPCENLQPEISGSVGPFTFTWFPADGLSDSTVLNPCARPDSTTIYTLLAESDVTGCKSSLENLDTASTVVVNVNPIPQATANHDGPIVEICEGECYELSSYGTGAGPTYEFEWSPSTGLSDASLQNPMACPTMTTMYTLTVNSRNCPSIADSVKIIVHTRPTVEAGNPAGMCLGDSIQLSGTAGGDSTTTYELSWYPENVFVNNIGEVVQAIPDTTSIVYLMATTGYGCESYLDSVELTVLPTPVADAGPDFEVCEGEQVQLKGGYSYTTTPFGSDPTMLEIDWTPGDSLSDSHILKPTTVAYETQSFTLTMTYNSCVTTDEAIVRVVPKIEAGVSADTTVICEGQSAQLFSSGGLGNPSYSWTPTEGISDPTSQNPIVNPAVTTEYTLQVNEGMCSDTGSVTIFVYPQPQIDYWSSQAIGCEGLEVDFHQTQEYVVSWSWDFGDGHVSNEANPSHVYEASGIFDVILYGTGFGSCTEEVNHISVIVSDEVEVDFESNPSAPVEISDAMKPIQFFDNSKFVSDYFWEFGDGITSQEKDPIHYYELPGEYYVTLTAFNQDGCYERVVKGPYIIQKGSLELSNVFSPNGDGINDEFLIGYKGNQPFSLTIYDRWGGDVFHTVNSKEGWNGNSVNGSKNPTGVYFYHLNIGEKEYTGNITLIK